MTSSLPSLYGCLVDQGVPRQHVDAASTAMSVFLEAHLPRFIAYINRIEADTAAMHAETLRLVGGEA